MEPFASVDMSIHPPSCYVNCYVNEGGWRFLSSSHPAGSNSSELQYAIMRGPECAELVALVMFGEDARDVVVALEGGIQSIFGEPALFGGGTWYISQKSS
jgi:hypothetical protein